MSDDIAHAIEAIDDIEATTPEALVVRVCDALSAARPGARNISAENFVERMRDLENVATGFKGIDKAYAISAGREIRVGKAKVIDDRYQPRAILLSKSSRRCSILVQSKLM